jgi:WD40 repeat protein
MQPSVVDARFVVPSSSIVALLSSSTIFIIDSLLPPKVSTVQTIPLAGKHNSLCFSPSSGLLIASGATGDLKAFDIRKNITLPIQTVDQEARHRGRIPCLEYDQFHDVIVSGGIDGCVKIWSCSFLDLVHDCGQVFSKQRFFRHASTATINDSFGITALEFNEDFIVAAGPTGSIKFFRKSIYSTF